MRAVKQGKKANAFQGRKQPRGAGGGGEGGGEGVARSRVTVSCAESSNGNKIKQMNNKTNKNCGPNNLNNNHSISKNK